MCDNVNIGNIIFDFYVKVQKNPSFKHFIRNAWIDILFIFFYHTIYSRKDEK